MDNREHYEELNALVGAIAKALEMTPEAVAQELETGAIDLTMGEDANGNRYVEARRGPQTAQVYQGAIRHAAEGDAGDGGGDGGGGTAH